MNFRTLSAGLALALCVATSAFSHGFEVGELSIGHPWTRATPGGAKVGGGYFSIENKGAAADRLIGATFSGSDHVEIHEMTTTDGVMRMNAVEGGVEVPADGKVEFKPGGYHLMLMGLKAQLVEGQLIEGTLTFEKAGSVGVEFKVEPIGAKGDGGDAGGHAGHGSSH